MVDDGIEFVVEMNNFLKIIVVISGNRNVTVILKILMLQTD